MFSVMLSILLGIFLLWTTVFFVDTVLKNSKYGAAYLRFLHDNGLSVSAAHIRWQTTIFNRLIIKIGHYKPLWMKLWFDVGVVFGALSMISSVLLLLWMFGNVFTQSKTEQVLQPAIPGMNLPFNQLLHYIVTLVICGVFHEVGHAIAAVRENVRVNSFGLFVLILYPGAFVELLTDQLEIISPWRRLRIYCAGVWHNFVLALVAFLCSLLLPYLLSPFYFLGSGVLVTWIHKSASISSELLVGDAIHSVNNCQVSSTTSWLDCLHIIEKEPTEGYCNPLRFVEMHNSSMADYGWLRRDEPDCCNDTSSYRFCFYHQREHRQYSCLPARLVVAQRQTCARNNACLLDSTREVVCIKPLLNNITRLVRIKHANAQDILFVGQPRELISTIVVSNYVPKYFFCLLNLPEHLLILCTYILSISSALSLLNMMPCFFLDGHQTLDAFFCLLLPTRTKLREQILKFALTFGTSLLAVNIFIGFYLLVSYKR